MLPAAYRWIESAEGAYLHFNALCVATVRHGSVRLTFEQRTHEGRCGSVAHGRRFVERWIMARPAGSLPGGRKRR